MNLSVPEICGRGRREASERSRAAFTLVEIALSIAIIGFALVAIIGVLPAGLNVQKENREETIIVHEANYFLDAIRSGARGLDDLTNYVESITNVVTRYGDTTNILSVDIYAYTYTNSWRNGTANPAHALTNGANIIGLLSTPKYTGLTNHPAPFSSNYVIAYVRALSGPAVEKAPQTNASIRDLSFRYRLLSEVVPFRNWTTNWVDYHSAQDAGLSTNEIVARSNYWQTARMLQNNMHEVRLLFRWPVDSRGAPGNQRQVFRGLFGGSLSNEIVLGEPTPRWFIQPGIYQKPL